MHLFLFFIFKLVQYIKQYCSHDYERVKSASCVYCTVLLVREVRRPLTTYEAQKKKAPLKIILIINP